MDVTAVAQVADVLLPQGDFSSQPAEQFFPVLLGKLAARNEQSPNRGEEAEAAGWPLVPIIVDSRKWAASSLGTPRAIQEGLLGGELESAEGVTDSTGGLLQEEAEAGSTFSLLGHESGEDTSPTNAAASWAATAIPMALKTPAQAGVPSKESYPPGHTRSALGDALPKPPWNDVAPLRLGAHGAASPEMREEGLLRAEVNEVPNAVLHEPEGTAKPFGFPAGEDGRSNEAVRSERGSSRDLGIPPDLKPLDSQRGSEGQEVLRPGWALGSDGSLGVMDQGGAPELNVQLPRAAELRADPNTSVSTASSPTAGQERVWRWAQSAGSFQWGGAQVAYISLDPLGGGPDGGASGSSKLWPEEVHFRTETAGGETATPGDLDPGASSPEESLQQMKVYLHGSHGTVSRTSGEPTQNRTDSLRDAGREAVRSERGSSRDLGIPPDLKPLDSQRGSEGQEVLRPGWALGSDGSLGVMDQGGAPELNVQLPRAAELRADPNTSVSTASSPTAGQERVWRWAQSAGSFQWGGAQVAYISLDPPGVGPVRLKVRVTKEVVDAVFTVQSPQQKVFLEDGLWQLRHGLWERGLSPQQLWVEVGSNGEGRDAQRNAPGVPLHVMVHPHSVLEEEVVELPTYSHKSGSILHVRV